MRRIKKLTAAMLSAMLLISSVSIAHAKAWVNVSGWAYNDVSAFTNEGMLPESFNSVSDYRINITRGQFAELIYSMLLKANAINIYMDSSDSFDDADGAAEALAERGIVSGTSKRTFSPEAEITRQDAAVMLLNAAKSTGAKTFENNPDILTKDIFFDQKDISDYALNAVMLLSSLEIISGDDAGYFKPKDNITIEQAIILTYRVYNRLPYTSKNDGSDISSDEEVLIQAYGNGFYETKKGNKLYITDGINHLLELETDIYSGAVCYVNKQGAFVMARKYNKDTDVYDMNRNSWIYTIENPVINCSDQYIFTVSADNGTKFGVYDYSGHEVLPAEYSIIELKQQGYYDVHVSTNGSAGNDNYEKVISDVFYNNKTDIQKTTYVGTWTEFYQSYKNNGATGRQTGISSYMENCVAVLTNVSDQTIFDMTWIGLSRECSQKVDKYDNAEIHTDKEKRDYKAIVNDKANYTDLYHLTLTKVECRYGDNYGIKGYFTLTKNGEICFENAKGYLYGMPPERSWEYHESPTLIVDFDKDGKTYEMEASFCFKNKTEADEKVIGEKSRKVFNQLYDSDNSVKINFGEFSKARIDNKEYDVIEMNNSLSEEEPMYSGSAVYETEAGISHIEIVCGADNGYCIRLNYGDDATITDKSISGDFYVIKIENDRVKGVVDVFRGTLSGIDGIEGGGIQLTSEDGRYIIETEIAEKTKVNPDK